MEVQFKRSLQRFFKMSIFARLLPTGRQVLFYSEDWNWERTAVFMPEKPLSSPRSVSLHFFLCLSDTSAATSVWWSALLRWMNLIHVMPPSFYCRTFPVHAAFFRRSAVTLGSPTASPWRSPWGMEVHNPRANVLLPWQSCCGITQLLCDCWTGCNGPSTMYSNKSHKKNKWRDWRERGSGGQQPQCFLNKIHLNSPIWWRIGRRKRCQWGLPASCSEINEFLLFGQKHNPASAL